jgi:5'-3' exonuclease
MSELLLIDLSGLAHMQWHVSGSEPDPNWTSTKVVERVRGLASGYPHVAVCIDSGRSFRKDIDPTYKATRPEHLATLQHQIDLAIDTLRADGFPIFGAKGYEADDIIATCVDHALTSPLSPVDATVKIVSSDKDLTQLVSDRVSVQSATNGHVYDVTGVIAKFGVKPKQIRDYLALVGDVSDNIIGAKGIGAKRAAQLLQQFDSLAGIFDAKLLPQITPGVTPAIVTALREFQPRAETVKALLTLKTDAPIPFDDIWRERVPQDAAEFAQGVFDDIEEAMPTLIEGPQVPLPEDEARSVDDDTLGMTRPIRLVDSALSSELPIQADPAKSSGDTTAAKAERNSPKAGAGLEPAALHPELLLTPVEFERQLEPRNIAQAKQLAADLFASRLFSAYGHPAGVLATIIAGRELGLQTTASLRAIHIIDGKQALAADLIRALVLKSGKAEYFVCSERTSDKATFETKRKSDPKPITLTYTLQEGRQAWQKDDRAWTASAWGRNPADMCVARAGAKLARLVYPDVVHGLYAPEELE